MSSAGRAAAPAVFEAAGDVTCKAYRRDLRLHIVCFASDFEGAFCPVPHFGMEPNYCERASS